LRRSSETIIQIELLKGDKGKGIYAAFMVYFLSDIYISCFDVRQWVRTLYSVICGKQIIGCNGVQKMRKCGVNAVKFEVVLRWSFRKFI